MLLLGEGYKGNQESRLHQYIDHYMLQKYPSLTLR